MAVKATLEALHDAEGETLDELLAAQRVGVHATNDSPDLREGLLALAEKRKPVFNRSTSSTDSRASSTRAFVARER